MADLWIVSVLWEKSPCIIMGKVKVGRMTQRAHHLMMSLKKLMHKSSTGSLSRGEAETIQTNKTKMYEWIMKSNYQDLFLAQMTLHSCANANTFRCQARLVEWNLGQQIWWKSSFYCISLHRIAKNLAMSMPSHTSENMSHPVLKLLNFRLANPTLSLKY